jgi:hypothetical protein
MRKKNTKLKKRKVRKTRKQKKFRGGGNNAFYEVGTVVSTLGNAIQNSMSSFFIPPTPTNMPNILSPNPTSQYVYPPVTRSIAEVYNRI